MPRHVSVSLNGTDLKAAVPKLWIRQVTEDIASPDITTAVFPGWDGERPVLRARRSLKVTIAAQIHELFDLAARSAAIEAIGAWVGSGGLLTVSYRPGRQLRVVPTSLPALGAVRDYSAEIRMELTAYAVPYWEAATASTASGTAAASGSVSLEVAGTRETPLDAVITAGAAVTELTLTAGGKSITLEGLDLASGDTLTLAHTADGWLTIEAGGTGLMQCRTEESADDLEVGPGGNTVTWEADGAVAVALSARGRFE